jgi:hypothetical protein
VPPLLLLPIVRARTVDITRRRTTVIAPRHRRRRRRRRRRTSASSVASSVPRARHVARARDDDTNDTNDTNERTGDTNANATRATTRARRARRVRRPSRDDARPRLETTGRDETRAKTPNPPIESIDASMIRVESIESIR